MELRAYGRSDRESDLSVVHQASREARLIVIANREPIAHDFAPDGRIVETHSTSGLVTAAESVMRRHGGVWVAHGSGSADRATVDDSDGLIVSTGDAVYRLRRVWLDAEEKRGYYYGFANEGLWPLCHRVHVRPEFRSSDFDTYWTINERFVEAAEEESDGEPALVLVQDYHFALAPSMLRERRRRMRRMRVCVSAWTATDWAARIVGDAAPLCSAPVLHAGRPPMRVT